MKFFLWIFALSLIIFLLIPSQEALSQETAEELYEAALFKKEAEGNLEGAVQLFLKIITDFPENRRIAAKAQLQIGICYEKLGLKQAQRAFQEVIDKYPEQTEAVKAAKGKLAVLLRAQTVVEKGDKEFRIKKIWTGGRNDDFGTPSLDGSYSSFVDWATGDLALRSLKTGETRRLTKDGTWKKPMEFVLNSVISPDNKLVAYSWYNPQETYDLRLIGLDGSNKRIIYSDKNFEIYPCSWSSDGRRIVARRHPVSGENTQIVLVNVSDGSIQVLKTIKGGVWLRSSYFSDDRYIVCDFPVEGNPENNDISLLSADGSREIPLVKHPANDRLLGCVPGKNDILFLSDRSGTWDLWAIKFEGGKVQGPPCSINRNIGEISPLAFTRNGAFYCSIFTRWFTTSIAPLDLATFKIQEDLSKPILGSNYNPVWSPDGKSLAYISEQYKPGSGYHRPLHVQNIRNGEDHELASDYEAGCLQWSSDGRFILVGRGYDNKREQEKDYNGGVYKIDVQSGQAIALVEFPPVEEWVRDSWWISSAAAWSHDENSIFYINRGKLRERDLKTGVEKILYEDEFLTRGLILSPDGEKLAFAIDDRNKEKGTLLIIPASGGESKELCSFQGLQKIGNVRWTADGKYLLFIERKDKSDVLRRISPEREESQTVWDPNKNLNSFSIHPSGKQIAFSTSLLESEVYVMENFLPDEKTKKKDKSW